jgi:hypothetical protein
MINIIKIKKTYIILCIINFIYINTIIYYKNNKEYFNNIKKIIKKKKKNKHINNIRYICE